MPHPNEQSLDDLKIEQLRLLTLEPTEEVAAKLKASQAQIARLTAEQQETKTTN